jgi:pyruvate dehydrogenase (quinone)
VFLADVGTPVVWAARYLRMNGKRRLIGSFTHGSMANSLPQAIGVQAAQPGRQVVTFSGDGGLAMMFGELITLRQLKLPVKIVVFNNGALSFVELEMKAAGLVNFGTELEDPNFAARSRPLSGCTARRVERPDDLAAALRVAVRPRWARVGRGHDGSTGAFHPTRPSRFEQVKNFTLYATRTVLSGRGDELIDLAKTNVTRHLTV